MSLAEREQAQQLIQKIISFNRQVIDEKLKSQPNEKHLAEVEEQLKAARLEFEAFKTNLYVSHPSLKAQRGDIRPISQEDAAVLIPNAKTALLDFIVTNEYVQLFVLTKDTTAKAVLNTYTVKIERKSLTEKVKRFRRRMAGRHVDFRSLSQELYGLLLKPAEKQLQGKTSLVISPDGPLWELPFQVLHSDRGRFLIEEAAISYAPSLSVLREMQLVRKKKQAPAPASLLALGNPLLTSQSIELGRFLLRNEKFEPY